MDVVGIRGDRVALVPIDPAEHLENCLRWFNDPEVTRWVLRDLPMTRAAEEEWFASAARSQSEIVWGIHTEDGRHIGMTGLHGIDYRHGNAVTGIVIGEKDCWGQGYATEVLAVRTRWVFDDLGLRRLESECFAENAASARCLEKTGYRRIGTARKRIWRGGRWHDLLLWELLAEEWRRES
jgi:RimJ/RimL family protein N-acetyltransferase